MPGEHPVPPPYWDHTQPHRPVRPPPAEAPPAPETHERLRPVGVDQFQRMRSIRPPAAPPRRPGCLSSSVWFLFGISSPFAAIFLALAAFVLFVPPERTHLLLLGLDRRPGETGPSRTDTMILANVDPARPYVGMLSIPRDLWVSIPGRGENRINTAHFFAEAAQAGAGPQAALQTVSANFGVPVDRYLRIDFEGFVRIIDSVGGVELDVPAPLIDYEYPTYDYGTTVVEFQAGPQHMDGERALAYARIRHGSSDFKRAERQGLVIQAFFNRLLEPSAWPYFPALAAAIQSSVDTNLDPLTLLRLAPTFLRIGPGGIDRRVIQGDMVQPFTTSGGAAVQLPVWERINPVVVEMFGG
jgi:LCP family protein required for cell wall assembly